jgi:hypothetical protein
VFTSSSFNNRFEHESSLFEPITSKLTSSSACLHPYSQAVAKCCSWAELKSILEVGPKVKDSIEDPFK